MPVVHCGGCLYGWRCWAQRGPWMISSIYQTFLFEHTFKLKLWLPWSSCMMWENEVVSVMLRVLCLLPLFHKVGGQMVFRSGSAVTTGSKKLFSLFPRSWNACLRPPYSSLKQKPRNTHLLRGGPAPMCSWAPSWRPRPRLFHRMSLLMGSYTLPSSSSVLKNCMSSARSPLRVTAPPNPESLPAGSSMLAGAAVANQADGPWRRSLCQRNWELRALGLSSPHTWLRMLRKCRWDKQVLVVAVLCCLQNGWALRP